MAFLIRHLESILLGTLALISGAAFFVLSSIDTVRLDSFGPTARIYFEGTAQGLLIGFIILAVSCIACVMLRIRLPILLAKTELWFNSLSSKKENLLILAIALAVTFISHAGNITSGYFAVDDLLVGGLNNKVPFSEAILTPYANDHLFPLFRTEMYLAGDSAVFMSVLVFLSIALVPYLMYFVLKRWKISTLGRMAFIFLYAGIAMWADHITGYYAMSLYPQIIFFFSVALLSLLKWKETRKTVYAILFALSVMCSIAIDIAGIWSILALFIFIVYDNYSQKTGFSIDRPFFRGFASYKTPLAILVSISIFYAAFFYLSFSIIQPNTFLVSLSAEVPAQVTSNDREENWKPIPLITNYFNFIANGVTLPLVFPHAPKLLAHPAFIHLVAPYWNFVEALLIIGNLALVWAIWKHADPEERKRIIFLFIAFSLCAAMTILARPNHSSIPDYDFRYAGSAFFFYLVILSIGASIYTRNRGIKAITITTTLIIILFSLQQIFGFHEFRLKNESQARKADMIRLKETLFPELVKLGSGATIPNLRGSSISEIMPGPTLAHYLLFYYVKNAPRLVEATPSEGSIWTGLVEEVSSVKDKTSDEFIVALKNSPALQSYYANSGRIEYTTATSGARESHSGSQEIIIRRSPFDPKSEHILHLTLLTDHVPGTFDLVLSFDTDIEIRGEARIRIDDYTPFSIVEGKRVYSIQADLSEIVLYDLSSAVSNLRVVAPQKKNAQILSVTLK
jgi:hypothetical protein